MAKAEHLLALAAAAIRNDRDHAVSVCWQILEGEKLQSGLRVQLERILLQQKVPAKRQLTPARISEDCKDLVLQTNPCLPLSEVLLPKEVENAVAQFLNERRSADALRAAGLMSPHRLLLSGPPGNGKTTLAGAIAGALESPFLTLDYSQVLSSYMGLTGSKLAKIFRGVATTDPDHPVVLFLDEMETLLTERGKSGDTGEIVRITSSLLLEIDRLPDHVVLIVATNHLEMLDRAVVRRFEHHWKMPAPTPDTVDRWLSSFSRRHPSIPLAEHKADVLRGVSEGGSLSDVERTVLSWCREWVVRESLRTVNLTDRVAG